MKPLYSALIATALLTGCTEAELIALINSPTQAGLPAPVNTANQTPAGASPAGALTPPPAAQAPANEVVGPDGIVGGTFDVEAVEDSDGKVRVYATNTFQTPLVISVAYDSSGLEGPEATAYRTIATGRTAVATFTPSGEWSLDFTFDWFFGDLSARHAAFDYRLPFAAGTRFEVNQGAGGDFSHQAGTQDEAAVDWDMPIGTPILASRGGVVVAYHDRATTAGTDASFEAATAANWVAIRHDDGTVGEYWHLNPRGVKVRVGQQVQAGQVIAESGNTGYSSGPHLHFGVFAGDAKLGTRSQPFKYLTKSGARQVAEGNVLEAPALN